MRNSILSDIRTAARLFKQVRQAGKEGVEVRVRKAGPLSPPIMPDTAFIHTMEGHTLVGGDRGVYDAAAKAFAGLPREERCRFARSPGDGEYIGRAHFWKRLFGASMPPGQAREAMIAILHHYIQTKTIREGDRKAWEN